MPSHVVDALAGHTAYAQAGAPSAAGKVVGHIVKISGSASVVRNGVTIVANVGDAINQNDVVQTGSGSTLGLALDDGTTFNLSESSRFQLNELTYDANSTSNSSLMTLVQGAASFVAGQVARTGDMKVATPTATLGIRGTAVNLSVSSTDGTVSVSVVDQRDGQVHAVQVFANNGTLIGTVTSNGASLTLTPTATFDVIAQQTNKTPAQIAQEFNAFQQVLSTYDAAKQILPNLPQHTDNTNQPGPNDSNPKSTTKFAGSPPVDPPGTEYHPPVATTTVQSASAQPPPTTVNVTQVTTVTDTTTTQAVVAAPITVKTTSLPFIVTPQPVAVISSGAGDHTGPVMSASGDLVYDPDGIIHYYDHTTGTTTTIASPSGGWTYGLPTISLDGRYIVYQGFNGSGTYVFVYGTDPSDTAHYHVQTQLGPGSAPAVSGDGGTIVAEQGVGNIAIYDLQGNLKGTITAATVNSGGAVWKPAISADGHIIAFWNSDSNSAGGSGQLYTYNLATGGLTQIASVASGAGQTAPAVSADGHLIAYQSTDSSGHSEIYLYDLGTGTVVFHTANASGSSYYPVLSPDGHFIAFTSDAQLTPNDRNNFADIYIVDVSNPAAPVYKLVSEGSTSGAYNGVAISAGGQYVAFGDSTSIFFVDPTSGRAAVIVETSKSPAILTTSGQIAVTGDYSGVALGVTDQFGRPTSNFSASFDAAGHINWTFSEAKSDFDVLSYGQDATQEFIITLTANDGTVTIPVFVTVHDGVQPTISAADFAPIAKPVSLSEGQQNTSYTITAADLLKGVVDIDGPLLSITALSLQTGSGNLSQIDSQTWTYTPVAGFSGRIVLNYTTTDSIKSASSTASLKIALPLAITSVAPDSGVAGDFITSNTNLTVSGTNGTLTSGETIQISSDNGVTWADVVQTSGTGWSFTDPLTHTASFTYKVRVVDSNLTAINATSQAVVIDTAPPVLAVTNAGGFTNQISLTLAGTLDLADVGAVVTVFDDGQSIGTATVQADGSWSKIVSLHSGANSLNSQAADIAGNTGTSNTVVVTLDTTAPAEALAIAAINSDTGTPSDFVTSDTTLTVSGTNGALAADEKIQISSNGGVTWADVTQSTATSWSYVDPATHGTSFTYQVRIVDLAGNIGTTASQAITIDTTAPSEALAVTAISTDSGTAGDFVTNDTSMTVSGTNGALTAGEKIQVSGDGGASWVDVTQSTSTTWTYTDPATHASSFTYLARIVDLAGNIGTTTSQAITIDTTAPAETLAITAINTDSGTAGDFVTNDTTLTVLGTNGALSAGERIQVSSDGGTTWADVTQSTSTTWSYVDPATRATSFTYQTRIVDLAGNIGTAASQAITIDTAAPAEALAIAAISTDSGTAGDFVTNDTTLTVSGTNGALSAGEKIQVSSDGGATWANVTQPTSTTWTYTDPATHASGFTYQARIIDLAGNIGTTASQAITIDTAAPAEALAITAISQDTGTPGDFVTNDTTLTVSGTNSALAAGEKIQVSGDGGSTWADVTQSTSTTWTYTDPATHSTSFSYQARIVDLAGNIGTTAGQVITIDTTAPSETLAITAISTDSGTAGDFVTNDTTLTVSGTNAALLAGEKIQVSGDGGLTWTDVTQSTSTSWTYTDPATHSASFNYQARIVDLAGNIGTTASQAITIDTTAPTISISNAGGPTNQVNQTIIGSVDVADEGATVTVYDGGTAVATALVQNDGSWSTSASLSAGTNSLTAKVSDLAGNTTTSNIVVYTLSTSGPVLTEHLTSDTGSSAIDQNTSNPALTGTGLASTVVHFTVDGTPIATTVLAGASGNWSFTPSGLADGSHSVVASQTDTFGNTGSVSLTFTLDTAAPAEVLAITAISTDTGTAGDFITSDTTLTVTGSNGALAVGEKIQVSSDGGSTWANVTQSTSTTWTYTDPVAHSSSFTYQARIVDLAGNIGTTASQVITIDTTAPSEALAITAISTDSGTAGDFVTNDTTLTVSGTNGALSAGEKIQVSSDGGSTWADVTQSTSTSWTYTDPATHTGSFTYQSRIIDLAGNIGTVASQAVTIDTTAPSEALAITAISTDSGTAGDFVTSDMTLIVSGTNGALSAGEKIQASGDAGTTWADVTQSTSTTWSYTDPVTHATSFTYQTRIVDLAGNIGTTASQAITIDTAAPAEALAITAISTDSGTAGDFVTNDTSLTVSGTNGALSAGEKIQVSSDGGSTWADVTQSTSTSWTYTDPATHTGSFTYQSRIIDLAGNIGTTASQAITIDSAAPAEALAITAISQDTGTPGDFVTNDTTLTVSGSNGALSAGEKIQVSSDGGATWVDVTQSTSTGWTYTDPATHASSFTYQARIVDTAANVGTTASQAITIDTTAPSEALAITAITTDSGTAGDFVTNDTTLTVSGTNGALSAGDKIQVSSDGGTTWADVTQSTSTTWTYTDPATHSTNFSYEARIIDTAGNIGTTASHAVTIDITAPAETLAITAISTDSGTAGDFITSDTTLTVSGSNGALNAGEKIQVSSDGGSTWADVTQSTSTTWTYTDSVTHSSSFTYQARIVDLAGNIGTTASQAVTIDTTAPAEALAVTAISTDTGTVGDFVTNDTSLTVSGTNGALTAGEKIQVSSDGGTTWADVTQSTSTSWTYTDPATHSTSFSYQARIVDLAGNIGTTASQAITIDTTAPVEALAITAISTDSGTAGDFVTNDTTLTVSGTNGALSAGEKMQVSSDGGTTWADVTQSTSTTWTYTDPATHSASFSYQARIIDTAGNVGTTASQAITIDTTAPAEALAVTAISTDSGTAGDFVTNDTTLTVSGTNGGLAVGEKIQVSVDSGATWADVTQSTSTTWTYTDPVTHSSNFTYQARIVDLAGNIGTTASQVITIDTTAPSEALAITAISTDSGTAGDFVTNDTTLTVSGSNGALTAGEKIQVSGDGGSTWVDVTQSTSTTWTYTDPVTHASSFTYQARIVDAAANVGTTASQAITIDTTAPSEALAITAITTDSGTAGDFVTNDTTLTVSGTNGALSAGDKIQVSSDGGTTWADVTQSTSTTWTYTDPATHSTSFNYQARIIDTAGNTGTTASHAVTIDITAPAETLAITAISTDSGTAGDFITNDTTLTVSGSDGALTAGEKIQVSSDGGATWADVTQSTSTTWTYTDPATHASSFTYQTRIIDLAGNIGTTASQAITIDTTAPSEALEITAISQDTGTPGDFVTNDTTLTVSGTNGILSAGEKIQVSNDGGSTWADATSSTSTTWSYVDPVTHASSFTYQARIVDAAGNIGTTTSQVVTIDTSAPTETLAIGSIAGSASPTSTAVTVSGTNSALQAGDKVQISTDGTNWTDVTRINPTRWSFVDAALHTAGFTYSTRVVDSTGNTSPTVNQLITVANGGSVAVSGGSAIIGEMTGGGGAINVGVAGLSATLSAISTASGPATIGVGGLVTTTNGDAIDFYATGSTLSLPANLNVNANAAITGAASGISVLQNAYGYIAVAVSAAVTGQSGRGIYAQQSATGNGSITISGAGNVTGTGAAYSGIVATILNTSNNNDITVNESGNITGGYDGIRVTTYGNGNEFVTTGGSATITGVTRYGIEAQSVGTGSITITTGASGTVTSPTAAISAYNQASVIPKVNNAIASSIAVTSNGTINSGTALTNSGSLPAGVLAGYKGGINNTVNANVYGNVTIDNYANITAAYGDGIRGYNFGSGDVTINQHSGTIKAKDEYGISASSSGSGNVSIVMSGGTIEAGSHGITAINQATAIAVGAGATVSVTAAGTIKSGTHLTAGGSQPQGISAGYYGSNGTVNANINGSVTLDNSANVTALAGWGLLAYNWGNGSVTLTDRTGTIVWGAQYGVQAASNVSGASATPSTVTLTVEANAQITAGALYGLVGVQATNTSGGSIFVTTNSGDQISSGGTGINANAAPSSALSGTQIFVTAAGTIKSGFDFFSNATGPSGISAGFGTSNGQVNSAIHGDVVANVSAAVTAASGWGLNLYNFGTGNVSATVQSASVIKAPVVGINAFAQGGGSVTITNNGSVISAGTGIATGTGGNGLLSVTNAGSVAGSGLVFNQVVQINSSNSNQPATFTNSGTVTANMFAKSTNSYALAMYTASGTVTVNNNSGGILTGNVQLGGTAVFSNKTGATWSLNGQSSIGSVAGTLTNDGIINMLSLAVLMSGGSLALANNGTTNVGAYSAVKISGGVSGSGTIAMGDRSSLEIFGGVTGQTVDFAYNRGLLTIDLPASYAASNTLNHLAIGDVIALTGAGISSATLGSSAISVTGASQNYTLNVTNAQSGAMMDILAADKLMLVSASSVQFSDNLQHTISSPALFYVLDHDTIHGAGSGFVINATDANTANTYVVVVNQSSSINVTGTGFGVGVTTTGANIAIVNAASVSSGGTGISSSSAGGNTDVTDYGAVTGTKYAIAALATTGKLNVLVGSGVALTSNTSYGLYAQTTAGDINITTMSGSINSGSAGILAQEQGFAGAAGSITILNQSTITSGSNAIASGDATLGPANGSAGIRTGILNNGGTSFTGSTTTGNVYVEDRGNITAATGSGIFAFNYGAGNTTVSLGQSAQIQATAAGTTTSGFTQYGIFAFNYGAGSTTVTTGWGSKIQSGGTGINAGDQAAAIAQGSGSMVTVIAEGTINSGASNNNSGGAPAGILVGYNPSNAGVYNPGVYGDVFVGVYGDGSTNGFITAAAGSGINAFNYGVGSVTVTLGSQVSIQALTAATSSSGIAPYGIGAFILGAGNITVTMGSGDNIQSGSTGINAVNEASSIAANVGATIAVTAAGTIHSRTLVNNSGNQPAGISAGFLGGLSSTANLNVNGTVIVNNAAAITADAGIGINAYNFGNGNITVNVASGANISAVAQAIDAHAEGAGTGDIAVNVYANTQLTSSTIYGILALSTNNGSISVITSTGDVINAAGAGINAVNEASATSVNTSIVVTAAGVINSGTVATGFGGQPAGILAGYVGQTTSPGSTNPANYNVHGDVVVGNFATITAAVGNAIQAYTYGTGDVYVSNFGASLTALGGASPPSGSGLGILAQSYGPGSIYVSTSGATLINSGGSGIVALNKATTADPANPTTVVPATSVVSVIANGKINSGTIPTASAAGDPAAGILAGYNPNNLSTANNQVFGSVFIDDHATIVAPTGTDGIRGVNYGTGDISIVVESDADIIAGRYGVAGIGYDGGDVSISIAGSVFGGTAGLDAITTGARTATIDIIGFVNGVIIGYNATVTNEAGADWQLGGSSVFTGTSTFSNAGTIESTGVSSIQGLAGFTNTGTIAVETGSLTIGSSVIGGGVVIIHNATLTLGAASDVVVSFDTGPTTPGVLSLADPAHFTGTVTGFAYGDTIDLAGIAPANVSISNSGGLTVSFGTGAFALVGNYDPTGFSITPDGQGGTNIVWNHQAPVIVTSQLSTTHNNFDGSTTITGLLVTDTDSNAGTETFSIAATTAGASSGSSVSVSTSSGSLSAINGILASGATYLPGATPPVTDMVSLTVKDGFGATETVNFIFNQAGTGPNISLQGTTGNDVIFATSSSDTLISGAGHDQFVFAATSASTVTHTVTDFSLGIDKLDVRAFSSLSASSTPTEIQVGNDTLISLDANDSVLLKNVLAANLHTTDFIFHA